MRGNGQSSRVLFVVPEDWFFWTHRRALARYLVERGCAVAVACRVNSHRERIESLGVEVLPLKLTRGGRNPAREIGAVVEIARIIERYSPDLLHLTTVKPVLYGGLAAIVATECRVVCAVPGLGLVYVSDAPSYRLLRFALTGAYKVVSRLLGQRAHFVFENPEDRDFFVQARIVPAERASVILGMGCDVSEFQFAPEPELNPPVLMMLGRLLWSKGVGELVHAGRILADRGVSCRVVLVGAPDHENPDAVPEACLRKWSDEGVAEWAGPTDRPAAVMRQCNVHVLPTKYGEGLPKALIEAAATGRASVTTDVRGCREIVLHGTTGFLVRPGDSVGLADAIEVLLRDRSLRKQMGASARALVEQRFADSHVISETMSVYRSLGFFIQPSDASAIANP